MIGYITSTIDHVSLMPVLDILRSSLYDDHLLPILQL